MAAPTSEDARAVPRHLRWVAILGFLFGAVGALDYFMTQTHNAEYMQGFTPEQLEFFYGLPAWVVSAWAVAVWGSVLGCVLLLARRRLAVPVLAASLIGTIVTTLHNFGISNGMEIMGSPSSLMFTGLIVLVAFGLWAYARGMANRDLLY